MLEYFLSNNPRLYQSKSSVSNNNTLLLIPSFIIISFSSSPSSAVVSFFFDLNKIYFNLLIIAIYYCGVPYSVHIHTNRCIILK